MAWNYLHLRIGADGRQLESFPGPGGFTHEQARAVVQSLVDADSGNEASALAAMWRAGDDDTVLFGDNGWGVYEHAAEDVAAAAERWLSEFAGLMRQAGMRGLQPAPACR